MHFILKHFTFNYSSCLSRLFKIQPVDATGQSKVKDRRDVWRITIAHPDAGCLQGGAGWSGEVACPSGGKGDGILPNGVSWFAS